MAVLTSKGLWIDKLSSINYDERSISFTDVDGAKFILNNDIVAHIISMASHKTKIDDLDALMNELCNCPTNLEKGKTCCDGIDPDCCGTNDQF